MMREFRAFILPGNVMELAIAVVLGVAFGLVVKSLVDDIIMPPIGILAGNLDFTDLFGILKQGTPPGPYATLADAKAAGAVTLRYGLFVNTVIYFLIVAFALFLLIKVIIRLMAKPPVDATTKECPYCLSIIPLNATKCSHCTSSLTL